MKIIKVVRNISKGGCGVIDEVICDDGLHYARKKFHPPVDILRNSQEYENLRKRFIREVKTQKVLPKDYFLPVLFDELNIGIPYFIMPIAEDVYSAEIKKSKLDNRHPEGLPDILNALEFLHGEGLVHRDLKPDNILKHEGVWKLADFGLITKGVEFSNYTVITRSETIGTIYYCAPEQSLDFARITHHADIYSFGAILHDIFGDGKRIPHSELSASGEIGQIIAKCTKIKKELRFQNVGQIRNKLLPLLTKEKSENQNQIGKEWLHKFQNLDTWNSEDFEDFVYYLSNDSTQISQLFLVVTDEILLKLLRLSKTLFNDLSLIYVNWVTSRSFDFSYCDIIINNIYIIYTNTDDIEIKSKSVISAAVLGSKHNRWYVMHYVIKMADKEIDKKLAFRISLEIELDSQNKEHFINCSKQIGHDINIYNESIFNSLNG